MKKNPSCLDVYLVNQLICQNMREIFHIFVAFLEKLNFICIDLYFFHVNQCILHCPCRMLAFPLIYQNWNYFVESFFLLLLLTESQTRKCQMRSLMKKKAISK